MKVVTIVDKTGIFAENKDVARDIRLQEIMPSFEKNEEITIDFAGVEDATQSFIHALISDVLRKYGIGALDSMTFKSCNETVKKIISIVIDYMQEAE